MAAFIDNQKVAIRLKQEREKTNLSVRQFAIRSGVDQSQYSKIEKGELPITEKIMAKLEKQYGLNKEYILYGMNVPRANDSKSYIQTRRSLKLNKDRKRAIPFYDAEAQGGTLMETEMTPIHAPAGTIDVGDLLHDSEAAIRVYGNSMLPNYPPGCVVGLSKCSKDFIEPGEVYVIETRDRRILKRIFYKNDNAEGDYFICCSDNTMKFSGGSRDGKLAYPAFSLPKKEIINLFIVTGVIKRNTNSIIINRKTA